MLYFSIEIAIQGGKTSIQEISRTKSRDELYLIWF